MRQEQDIVTPNKGMNLDADPKAVSSKDGEYLSGNAFHMWPKGYPIYMKGNTEVGWDQPLGVNKCIGTFWHNPSNTQFQWHWNSLGNHTIVRYYPKSGANPRRIDIIAQGSEFNLKPDKKISGANMLDDEWLKWVDSGENRPRQISVKLADNNNKKNKIAVYFPYEPNEVDQRVFGASILLGTTTVTANTNFYTATSSEVFYFPEMLVAWANAFNATFTQFKATACNDHVELEAQLAGEWSVVPRLTDTVLGVIQPQVVMKWEYSNRYNAPWDYRQIDAARFMPVVPPMVSVINDKTRLVNDCAGHVFRFAYYYLLKDRYKSNMGAWSRVVSPAPLCNGGYDGNTILVDLSQDANLSELTGIGEVDRIHLAVSIDGGPWVIGGDYPKAQWIYTRKIMWANNGIYPAIDEAQFTETENASPIIAYSQEQFSSPVDPDNIRIAYGGCKEGHETPCIPVKLNVVIEDGDLSGQEMCELELLINVVNPWATGPFVMNQPVCVYDNDNGYCFGGITSTDHVDTAVRGQRLGTVDNPNTGFVAYIEGLDVYGVSTQVFFPGSVSTAQLTFIPNTTVLDLTKVGGAANPASRTHRAAYRDFVQGGGIVAQRIRLMVPTGRRVKIKLTSHKCAPLDDGTFYDISSPTGAWRGSSTFGCGFNDLGFAHSTASFYEMDVDVPTGTTSLYVGTCGVMASASPSAPLSTNGFICGYYLDDDGRDYSLGNDVRTKGTKAERQLGLVQAFDAVNLVVTTVTPGGAAVATIANMYPLAAEICNGRSVTDHNGFWFVPVRDFTVNYRLRMAWVSITGNLASPSDSGFAISPTGVTSSNGTATICNDGTDNKWRGDIDPIAALAGPDTTSILMTNGFAELIIPNLNPDARDRIRTFVEGTITTPGGMALPGIKVTMANGHTAATNQDGSFSVVAYGDMAAGNVVGANFNNRLSGSLLFSFNGACSLVFTTGNNYSGPVNITQFEDGLAYSEQVHFPMPDSPYTASLSSLLTGAINGRGTTFQVGLKLYDRNGRQTPVQILGLVRIPALTEDLHDIDPIAYPPGTFKFGLARIEWELLGTVPTHPDIEYVRLQFCRGADQRSSFRFEWVAAYAMYVNGINETTNNPILSNPVEAKEIYLNIGDNLQRYRDINTQDTQIDANGDVVAFGQLGYTPSLGDRIQILTVNGVSLTPLRDFVVRGARGSFIVIANEPNLPDFTGKTIGFRVYTPGTEVTVSDSKRYGIPFFELPEDSVEITNPFTNPQFAATSGQLHGGDTFRIATAIPVRPGFIPNQTPGSTAPWSTVVVTRETSSVIDSIAIRVPSLGRPWYADPQSKYELRGTLIRVSDVWLPGTGTNGSCRFRAGNSGTGNPSCGTITSMNELNGVVGCLCTVKSFAFYPGQTVSQTGDGVFISQGKQILGWIRDYAVEAGTQDPSSVVVERTSAGSWVKFWDARRSQVVRLSVNGFDPMEYDLGQKFNQIDQSYQGKDYVVVAGANTIHKEYWITFEPKSVVVNNIDVDAGARTLIFYEPTNSWICEYPVMPEMYGRTENEQQTFLNSRMWVQDDNETRGLFNGTKFPFRCKVALNSDPVVVSAYKALWVTPASAWEAPLIENMRGQQSSIAPELFEDWEGVSKSAIYYDILSPVPNPLFCGADMRDSIIIIELVNYSDGEVTLFAVDVRKVPSKATLR